MEKLGFFQRWINERGLRYCDNAGEIWRRRLFNVISTWCELKKQDIYSREYGKLHRLEKLGANLELRMQLLSRARYLKTEADRLDKHLLERSFLILTCYSCRLKIRSTFIPSKTDSTSLAVLFKDYVPGEHLCTECAQPMQTGDEYQMERELRELRIRYSHKDF